MRRGPPAEILAELRFACLLESRLAGPEGLYVRPLPSPPPEGEGVGTSLRLSLWLASLCLAICAGLRLFPLPFYLPWVRLFALSGYVCSLRNRFA